EVHEVAEATLRARRHLVLPAATFSKVRDGRELGVDRRAIEPAVVIEVLERLVRILLPHELDVDVADHVLANVLAHVDLVDLAVLKLALDEELFVEGVEILLLLGVQLADFCESVCHAHIHDGIMVEVLEKDGGREGRHVVLPRALVTVATGSDL
ncbi:hypothetical protein PMAYCL1PPCAC_20020, partial [Pristionchus mayeri]